MDRLRPEWWAIPTGQPASQSTVPGAPNFRGPIRFLSPNSSQLEAAYLPVYGLGIPSVAAMRVVLEKLGAGPGGGKEAVWQNIREEPVVYIRGGGARWLYNGCDFSVG